MVRNLLKWFRSIQPMSDLAQDVDSYNNKKKLKKGVGGA